MKSFFKLLLILSIETQAREIIIIEHDNGHEKARAIKEIIVSQQNIPKDYIRISESRVPCRQNRSAILKLCVKNGEMKLVNMQWKLVKSLKVFGEEN